MFVFEVKKQMFYKTELITNMRDICEATLTLQIRSADCLI